MPPSYHHLFLTGLPGAGKAVAAGNLDVEVQVENSRRDELGILATAFNSMTTQLRNLINSLEERIAEKLNKNPHHR